MKICMRHQSLTQTYNSSKITAFIRPRQSNGQNNTYISAEAELSLPICRLTLDERTKPMQKNWAESLNEQHTVVIYIILIKKRLMKAI